MSIEQLKISLQDILPNDQWEDKDLEYYISLAFLDTAAVTNIPVGLTFDDLTEGLKNTVLVGAKVLAMRTVLIQRAKTQATFGDTELTLDLDIETSDLLRSYNRELESFKQLCVLNKMNIKVGL